MASVAAEAVRKARYPSKNGSCGPSDVWFPAMCEPDGAERHCCPQRKPGGNVGAPMRSKRGFRISTVALADTMAMTHAPARFHALLAANHTRIARRMGRVKVEAPMMPKKRMHADANEHRSADVSAALSVRFHGKWLGVVSQQPHDSVVSAAPGTNRCRRFRRCSTSEPVECELTIARKRVDSL